jgi:ribosomal protein S12 methylthiotransferase accessory factor
MTEAAQTRLTYITGIRDDLSDYQESPLDKLGAALLDAVSRASEARLFSEVPNFHSDDVTVDLRWELERLHATGVERVIAVDLTRPEFDIPVVRVVIPGLEWDCTHPNYLPSSRARRVLGRAK